MKHTRALALIALLGCALATGCSREKAAPVVVASDSTPEQHRQIERAAAQNQPRSELDAAFVAYGRQDYATALFRFMELAEKGNARAAYYVGVMHSNGDGVERDLAESAKWYAKAAAQNDPDAQYALARLYVMGSGVEQDLDKALELFQKAAENYPPSEDQDRAIEQRLALLAVIKETDPEKAAELEKKAAAEAKETKPVSPAPPAAEDPASAAAKPPAQ